MNQSRSEVQIATSVLVVGAGGAGLRAAIELAERRVDVIVLGKRHAADAHTSLAAGGINAALATIDPDDTWQQHAADTLTESYLLAELFVGTSSMARAARGAAMCALDACAPARQFLARRMIYGPSALP